MDLPLRAPIGKGRERKRGKNKKLVSTLGDLSGAEVAVACSMIIQEKKRKLDLDCLLPRSFFLLSFLGKKRSCYQPKPLLLVQYNNVTLSHHAR